MNSAKVGGQETKRWDEKRGEGKGRNRGKIQERMQGEIENETGSKLCHILNSKGQKMEREKEEVRK